MPDDVTPQAVAPAPDAGQPTPQAVPESPDSQTQATPAVKTAATATPAIEKLWANKYKAPEVLEEAYIHAQAENSRMAQRLAQLEKTPTQTPAEPKQTYTPEQLETYKATLLQKQARAVVNGEDDKAQEYAGNIVWIDRELMNAKINSLSAQQTSQSAFQKLHTEMQPILVKHTADLQPGTPVFQDANAFYQQAVVGGMAANDFTAGAAVLLALAKHGKLNAGEAAKASQAATQNLNQAVKAAAAAGSGAANTNAASTPDFKMMAPNTPEGREAFAAYRKGLGVGT